MSRQPRIMLIAPYFPPHTGGTENYVFHVGERLVREHGFRVTVVTSTDKKEHISAVNGMRVYHLPYLFKISNTPVGLTWLRKIQRIKRRERPDLINVHTPVPFMVDLATFFIGSTPFVVTYHTGKSIGYKGAVNNVLTALYEKTLVHRPLQRADAIISSSDFVRNTFLARYKAKTRTIAPGVDFAQFSQKRAERANRLLFVGSLNKSERYKGLDIALEAMVHVTKTNPNARLDIVGDGNHRKHYEVMAQRLGVAHAVTFHGRQRGQELARFYAQASVFIHPSLFDSCPLVVLEAMAARTPVIGTNGTGIRYLIDDGKTGLLFAPGNAKALAQRIETLLANKTLRGRLAKAAYTYVRKEHEWDTIADRTASLFLKQIRSRGREPTRYKVLMLAPYYLPHRGGVEQFTYEVSSRLAKLYDWDVVIVTNGGPRGPLRKETMHGLTVYRLPYWVKLSNTPVSGRWPKWIRTIIAQETPDVLNAHTPVPFMVDVAARINNGIPFVISYHNDLYKTNPLLQLIANVYTGLVQRGSLAKADAIIISSEAYASRSKALGAFKRKSHIISPGVNVTTFQPHVSSATARKHVGSDPYVLFVGQLDKTHDHKGLDVLIRALAQARAHVPKLRLVVIGRGTNKDAYEALASSLGVRDAVTFAGFVSDKDIPGYYAASTATVLPSKNASEGFGMVLIEAAACGAPGIGSRVGGIPVVIEENKSGLLVPPNDVDALANALRRVASNATLRRSLGSYGRTRAVKSFSWEQKVKAYNAVLEEEAAR